MYLGTNSACLIRRRQVHDDWSVVTIMPIKLFVCVTQEANTTKTPR